MSAIAYKYPKSFWIMCLGAMSFFLSFNLILPELNAELRSRGGADYVGWLIPAFSFSALIARPFSGWITDNLGRKVAMIGGCLFCIVAGCFYPWVGTATGFLVVRAIHGFSTGFTPTGFTAFTADVVEESHRGRAMGWQGMFNNLGTTIGYALGALIAQYCGIDWMYYVSAALATTAWMMFMQLPETRMESHRRKFKFSLSQLFYWPAWKPSLIMFLVCISLGSILTVMADFTLALGYANKGLFLSIYIGVSLLFRLVSGRVSDLLGRAWSTAIGTFSQVLSMAILGYMAIELNHQTMTGCKDCATLGFGWFGLAAVFYGIGQGFNAPSLFAWASDTAAAQHRGRALAMLFMFLELGIIVGGLTANYFIQGISWNYLGIFGVSGAGFAAGLVLSLAWLKK
ncbi:MAG: MFS transporter [Bacteroidetes bacterium]|nr:MFS transporter [Bacteroidota bacterium]